MLIEAPRRVTAPKQRRSHATYLRLLDAAEQLLAERRIEEITIADIVEKAGSSVGSFYARFAGKEALVAALLERYHQDAVSDVAAAISTEEWNSLPLKPRARHYISMVVASSRERRGLLRLRLQLRLSESIALPDKSERAFNLVSSIRELFDPVKTEIRHPDPDRALTFALRLVDAIAATILMEEISGSFGVIDDDEIIDRMTEAFVSYLT